MRRIGGVGRRLLRVDLVGRCPVENKRDLSLITVKTICLVIFVPWHNSTDHLR